MHAFSELVAHCADYTLWRLNKTNDEICDALQTSASTPLVKGLQMVQLSKAILAVGMFSIFEAHLQDGLACKDGFEEAQNILLSECESELLEKFNELRLAINVLKHGRGKSYTKLVANEALPFRVKHPDEAFFFEGDVSEVAALIQVDDAFVHSCVEVIQRVSEVVKRARPDFL